MITMFLGPEVFDLNFQQSSPEMCLIFWHGRANNSPLLVKLYDPTTDEAKVKKMPRRDVRTKIGEEQIRNSQREGKEVIEGWATDRQCDGRGI